MTDDIDDFYERFNVEDGFMSEYHPARHIDKDILQDADPYKVSNIVEEDEPIAVADNSDEDLTIEVYERRPHSIFEKPRHLLGLLDDYVLHVSYDPGLNADVAQDANSAFLSGNYFEFKEEDYRQIEEFLNKFSDDHYNTFLRGKDL